MTRVTFYTHTSATIMMSDYFVRDSLPAMKIASMCRFYNRINQRTTHLKTEVGRAICRDLKQFKMVTI